MPWRSESESQLSNSVSICKRGITFGVFFSYFVFIFTEDQ